MKIYQKYDFNRLINQKSLDFESIFYKIHI